jgi:TonB family protein
MRQFKSLSALALGVFLRLSKRPTPAKVRTWLLCMMLGLTLVAGTMGQEVTNRKLRTSTPPEYPELARKFGLRGVARVRLTVAPDGSVTYVRELGGSPVFLESLTRAVKKWKYEPARAESYVEVKFEFVP